MTAENSLPASESTAKASLPAQSNANAPDVRDMMQAMKAELAALKAKIDLPWWRDVRFWGGILALPGLFLTGWLFKAAGQENWAFRFIHKGFGTEPAMTAALDEDKSEVSNAVAKTVARHLNPSGTSELRSAIDRYLGQAFVPRSSVRRIVAKLIAQNAAISHVDFMRMGLVDSSQLRAGCGSSGGRRKPRCIAANNSHLYSTQTLFSVDAGAKINVAFGLNGVTFDNSRVLTGYSPAAAEQFAMPIEKIESYLKFEIDDVEVHPQDQRSQYTYTIDGKTFPFSHVMANNYVTSNVARDRVFTMHSITVSAKEPKAFPPNLLVNILIIVTQTTE